MGALKFRVLATFLLVTFYLSLAPSPVSAHTLKSDGTIGAVIHIDPEDDPIIGEPASFFFEFKDTAGKFKPSECICLVTILKDDQELFSEQLESSSQEPSLTSASFSYTFPEKGVYQIKVIGNSVNAGSFDPFKLTYDLRVDRVSGAATEQSFVEKNIHFFLLGGILVIFLAIFFSKRIKKTSPNSSVTPKLFLLVLLVGLALASHNTQIDRVIFFHHDQNHAQSEHPCCRPSDIALISSPSLVNPTRIYKESINEAKVSYKTVNDLVFSNRSPPNFA